MGIGAGWSLSVFVTELDRSTFQSRNSLRVIRVSGCGPNSQRQPLNRSPISCAACSKAIPGCSDGG